MSHFTHKLPTVNKLTMARNRTFTLIEMLVVVVIIGILAGVLVPRLTGAKERASDSARIVKVWQISSAVELYAQEKGTTYPRAPLTGAPWISVATPIVTDAISPYLTNIPTDPGKWTVAISTEPGGILATGDSFAYWTNDAWTGYAITALMESKKGNTTNGTGLIDSDKQWWYQKVGRWLTTSITPTGGGGWPTNPITNYWPDIEITYNGKTYRIKDRNVGATQTGTDWYNPAIRGYHFQWGNNYGFPSSPALYTPNSTGRVDTSTYNGNYSSDIFRRWSSDRSTTTNNNLRPEKAQWPCPSWYHIPTQSEREDVVVAHFGNNPTLLMNRLQLPMAGYRYYDSAESVNDQGGNGYYWSSTPYDASAYFLAFRSSYVGASNYDGRAFGFSVRCFENSY